MSVRGLHLHLVTERAPEFEQRQAAAHCALGIVFARIVSPEHGEHAVANVLQRLALVRRDEVRSAGERAVHHDEHFFGIEALRERGRSDEVKEQDGDLAQCLRWFGFEGCSGRLGRHQRGEPRTQTASDASATASASSARWSSRR